MERTSVEFAHAKGENASLSSQGVCSDAGTNVTVTFESISLEVRHTKPKLYTTHVIVDTTFLCWRVPGPGGMSSK